MCKVLRFPDAVKITGLSKATLYRLLAKGEFVRPVRLSERAVGFHESEVAEWLKKRQRA